MKILITGGAGFIGYHLSKKLIEVGNEVIIYDKFLNFIDPKKSLYDKYLKIRLNYLKDKATIIRGDIRHKVHLFRVLKEHEPEAVVHLAALPIATISNKFSEDAISINLNGTMNVLELIRLCDSVKKFVYASSSMVYGNFEKPIANENHPTNPLDVYGATKLSGEILTKVYGKQYGISYTIIRPSAVYGPTDSNRRVSQIFVENGLLKKPLILHNGGLSKLDFSFVEDVADGFRLAIKSKKAENEIFNITRGEARSLKEFVDILKKHIPNIQIRCEQADFKRPERGTLDITKARKLLNYNPKYSLEKGLKIYVGFVRKHITNQ